MTIWRSPASLSGQTTRLTTLSRGILALAIMGAGLVFHRGGGSRNVNRVVCQEL
jgi:hypothetical protein